MAQPGEKVCTALVTRGGRARLLLPVALGKDLVPDAKADLTDHVLDKAIDGLFLYLGREEAAIRRDPAKRTTAILRKVFGR